MADYWDQYPTDSQPYSFYNTDLSGPMRYPTSGPRGGQTTQPLFPNSPSFGQPTGVQIPQTGMNWAPGAGPSGQPADKATVLKFIADWQASHPATTQSFQQLADALKSQFGVDRFDYNGTPSNNEFVIDGEKVKVLAGEDSGSPSWFAYGSDDGGGPNGGNNAFQLAPGYTIGDINGGGQYPLSSFNATGINEPWTTPFAAPTLNDTTDPGYLARFQLGTDAILKNKAATGTLRTGGALKDLTNYAQDYASNEYDKVYNRAKNQYDTARDIFTSNQNNVFNRLSKLGDVGLQAAS